VKIINLRVNIKLISLVICLLSICGATPVFTQTASKRSISVNFTQVKGKTNRFYREVVGAGRAAEGLRADWQRDLGIVHRECGFKYLRFHGLLQDEMGVYNEDKLGNAVYNFQYIDAVYDSLLSSGMKPFVEFGFMPEKLASGKNTSQTCICGASVKKTLAQRQHNCSICGLINHRDIVFAQVILKRAVGRTVKDITYAVRQSVSLESPSITASV